MWLHITKMIIICGIYLNQGQFISQSLSKFSFRYMYATFGRTQLIHELISSGVTLQFQIKIMMSPYTSTRHLQAQNGPCKLLGYMHHIKEART
jgi:hypothetical protein